MIIFFVHENGLILPCMKNHFGDWPVQLGSVPGYSKLYGWTTHSQTTTYMISFLFDMFHMFFISNATGKLPWRRNPSISASSSRLSSSLCRGSSKMAKCGLVHSARPSSTHFEYPAPGSRNVFNDIFVWTCCVATNVKNLRESVKSARPQRCTLQKRQRVYYEISMKFSNGGCGHEKAEILRR